MAESSSAVFSGNIVIRSWIDSESIVRTANTKVIEIKQVSKKSEDSTFYVRTFTKTKIFYIGNLTHIDLFRKLLIGKVKIDFVKTIKARFVQRVQNP
jgi:hypothetical protein